MFPIAFRLDAPDTPREVNVPVEVMFGCAAVVRVPVSNEAPTVPELAYTLPDVVLPVTANELNVPTEVMLACALVVTDPAVVADPAVATLRFAT